MFTRSLKLEIRWASVRVGLEQSGAKISLVALSPEHISVQFQSSSRSSPSLPARTLKSAAEPLLALLREATAGMT
ncbi:MAG: hypothetical protein DMG69_27085 [Acidobacteria bacterium]|nr:MAG: hypothetical protein DMG69_27085 [Acidobacteriota bacterium]